MKGLIEFGSALLFVLSVVELSWENWRLKWNGNKVSTAPLWQPGWSLPSGGTTEQIRGLVPWGPRIFEHRLLHGVGLLQVWFQNRRTKWRKRHAAEMASAKKRQEERLDSDETIIKRHHHHHHQSNDDEDEEGDDDDDYDDDDQLEDADAANDDSSSGSGGVRQSITGLTRHYHLQPLSHVNHHTHQLTMNLYQNGHYPPQPQLQH